MNKQTTFQDLGLIDFKEAWDYQEELFNRILKVKLLNDDQSANEKKPVPNHLLFCEHPHVFTLGKSGSESNLLINNLQLLDKKASFYKINRGGDITYHGPGQIVAYPILDLDNFKLSIRKYIYSIEEAVIVTLEKYRIKASRLEGATGVWLDPEIPDKVRKICAIGVRASRWVTMHGLALNINTDLSYFNFIHPCGMPDKAVTSLEKELGAKQDLNAVKKALKQNLVRITGMQIE